MNFGSKLREQARHISCLIDQKGQLLLFCSVNQVALQRNGRPNNVLVINIENLFKPDFIIFTKADNGGNRTAVNLEVPEYSGERNGKSFQ